jgi:hypothetical protein
MKLTASQLRQIIAEEYKDQSSEPNEYTDASKLTAIISSILKPEGKAPTSSETSPTGMINSYYTGANNPYAGMTISILDNDAVVMSPNGEVRRVFVNEHDTLEAAAEEVAENVKEFMSQIDADERAAEEILALPIGDFSSIPLPTYESKLTLRRLRQTIVEEILQRKKTMKLTNEEVKVLDRYGNPLKLERDWGNYEFELKDGSHNKTFKHPEGWALARSHYKSLLPKDADSSDDNIVTVKNSMPGGKNHTSESKLTLRRLKQIIAEEIATEVKKN